MELIDYVADSMEADDHTFGFIRGDAKDPQALNANLEKYRKTMHYLNKRRRKSGIHQTGWLFGAIIKRMYDVIYETVKFDHMVIPCVAGDKFITIDERGTLRPCEILWQKNGAAFDIVNLRENNYDLSAARKSLKSRSVRNHIKSTRCHCSFECANLCNIVHTPKEYPKLLWQNLPFRSEPDALHPRHSKEQLQEPVRQFIL